MWGLGDIGFHLLQVFYLTGLYVFEGLLEDVWKELSVDILETERAWRASAQGLAQSRCWKTQLLFHHMEKEMATHSSALARRVSWTEEPGGLLSMGSHRVGDDWGDLARMHALEKEMATHFSILAWRIPGTGEQSRTRLKWLSSSSSYASLQAPES